MGTPKVGEIWERVNHPIHYGVVIKDVSPLLVEYSFTDGDIHQIFENEINEFQERFQQKEENEILQVLSKTASLKDDLQVLVKTLNKDQVVKILEYILNCEEVLQNALVKE